MEYRTKHWWGGVAPKALPLFDSLHIAPPTLIQTLFRGAQLLFDTKISFVAMFVAGAALYLHK